jgi:hypothetical protein
MVGYFGLSICTVHCVLKSSVFWAIMPCNPLKVKSACYLLHAAFLLGLFFDPEDGDVMFLWNISWLSTCYMELYSRTLQNHHYENHKSYKNPRNRPWRPIGLWNIEASTFSKHSAHRWWWRQPYVSTALYLPRRFLVLISVRGWVDPRAIMWLEGLGQLKNPVTSLGIGPVTFWLVT